MNKIHQFINNSRSIGIVLLICTFLSLILTNGAQWGKDYHKFWELNIPIFYSFHLPCNFLHLINDALMAVFFFQVGMEIKRETMVGELSSQSKRVLPIIAALSGVIFPAAIFSLINKGTPYLNGWAIPTATDIAFSLGILSLLGKSVPHSLKVFLTALAIFDDLCAILIIALFYASNLHLFWLLGVVPAIVAVFFLIRQTDSNFRKGLILFSGAVLWYCMYRSGIHSTFSGVILAMIMPVKKIPVIEQKIAIPVNFIILPLFALANTSIPFSASSVKELGSALSMGIMLGLFFGKPLGITFAVWSLTKSKIIKLHSPIHWKQFIGIGILAGIGFTMSIFVSTLAFADKQMQDTAKLSVLCASFLAMIIGYLWLKIATPPR